MIKVKTDLQSLSQSNCILFCSNTIKPLKRKTQNAYRKLSFNSYQTTTLISTHKQWIKRSNQHVSVDKIRAAHLENMNDALVLTSYSHISALHSSWKENILTGND